MLRITGPYLLYGCRVATRTCHQHNGSLSNLNGIRSQRASRSHLQIHRLGFKNATDNNRKSDLHSHFYNRNSYTETGGTSVFRNSCATRKPRLYCSVKLPCA